jgi:hypothetical protein
MRVQASALRGMVSGCLSHCRVQGIASAVTAMTILSASLTLAPSAVADSVDNLRTAVMTVRSASCGPLRSNPLVEQAAKEVNRSTDAWRDFNARAVPVPDPLPLLKDLGYGGTKAKAVSGAGQTDAAAIKGLVIQGYLDIPHCSYTDYGVSVLRNRTTNFVLAVLVLAGA